MTTADSRKIIEAIRSAGSVRAEKGDFNLIVFTFHPETEQYSMERKYWQADTQQVMFENKFLSEEDLLALLDALYASEQEFFTDFVV